MLGNSPPKYLTARQRFLKNSNSYDRRTYSKFALLVQLWAQFTPWKSVKSKKVNIFDKINTFDEKIYPSGYPNMQRLRLYLVSILNEKCSYFLRYFVFFGAKMGPKPKDQEVRGQISTTFSEASPRSLTSGEEILVVTLGKLTLFQL